MPGLTGSRFLTTSGSTPSRPSSWTALPSTLLSRKVLGISSTALAAPKRAAPPRAVFALLASKNCSDLASHGNLAAIDVPPSKLPRPPVANAKPALSTNDERKSSPPNCSSVISEGGGEAVGSVEIVEVVIDVPLKPGDSMPIGSSTALVAFAVAFLAPSFSVSRLASPTKGLAASMA